MNLSHFNSYTAGTKFRYGAFAHSWKKVQVSVLKQQAGSFSGKSRKRVPGSSELMADHGAQWDFHLQSRELNIHKYYI